MFGTAREKESRAVPTVGLAVSISAVWDFKVDDWFFSRSHLVGAVARIENRLMVRKTRLGLSFQGFRMCR
jgi:hypothetical protein